MKIYILGIIFWSLTASAHLKKAPTPLPEDAVKQCTVFAYVHGKFLAGYYNYDSGTREFICDDAIHQCLVDGYTATECRVVYFGRPKGDE